MRTALAFLPSPSALPADNLVAQHRKYDLAVQPWIPIRTSRGPQRVGLVETLEHAHEIISLDVADSTERYGLFRYLMSLAYLAYALHPDDDWANASPNAPLPRAAVRRTVDRLHDTWWLFHPTRPFAQLPELSSLMTKPLPDAITSIVPYRPAKSNESWWYRDDDPGLALCDAPLALLSRHFAGLAGNEAGILGRATSRSEGGVATSGPQPVTSLHLLASDLAATLRANMVSSITDDLNERSMLFFEDPLGVSAHMDDALYLYSASSSATLLLEPVDETVQHVLRAPLPVPAFVCKKLMTAARLADPHVLRVNLLDAPPTKGLVNLRSDYTSLRNAVSMYLAAGSGLDSMRASVVDINNRVAHCAQSGLGAVSITTAGNFTGARIASVTSHEMDLAPFQLRGDHAVRFTHAAQRVMGTRNSCLSLLRDAVAHTIAGPVPLRPSVERSWRDRLDAMLWSQIEPSMAALFDTCCSSPQDAKGEISDDLKAEWVVATLDTFDDAVEPHISSARTRSRYFSNRAILRGALCKIL